MFDIRRRDNVKQRIGKSRSQGNRKIYFFLSFWRNWSELKHERKAIKNVFSFLWFRSLIKTQRSLLFFSIFHFAFDRKSISIHSFLVFCRPQRKIRAHFVVSKPLLVDISLIERRFRSNRQIFFFFFWLENEYLPWCILSYDYMQNANKKVSKIVWLSRRCATSDDDGNDKWVKTIVDTKQSFLFVSRSLSIRNCATKRTICDSRRSNGEKITES